MSAAGYYKTGSLDNLDTVKRTNDLLRQKMQDYIKRNAKVATMLYPGGAETNSVAEQIGVIYEFNV